MKKDIRSYRESLGFTQAELAEKTNLSIRTIQRVESGATIPKGHTLKVLSEAFGVEKEELLETFSSENLASESEVRMKLINLSSLSFLMGIPFGNIFVPYFFWNKYRADTIVDKVGRSVLNFQIIWTVSSCLLLIVSPFLQGFFPNDFTLILYVGLLAICVNIFFIIKTAISLNASQYDILPLKLRLF
ncbi:MAG: helix-turn-helix domain-containing protein [Saprospiraceae bacterium]